MKLIQRLIAAFGSSRDTASREVIEAYVIVASRYPASVVERVINRFIAGEISGQSLEFPPKPPQLGAALKAERLIDGDPGYVSPEQFRLAQIQIAAKQIEHRKEPEPESKERVAALLRQFTQGANVIREKEGKIL